MDRGRRVDRRQRARVGAQAGGGVGGAIGPFLGGWLFDVTGSYRLAFMAACLAIAGAAGAAWVAARPVSAAPASGEDEGAGRVLDE